MQKSRIWRKIKREKWHKLSLKKEIIYPFVCCFSTCPNNSNTNSRKKNRQLVYGNMTRQIGTEKTYRSIFWNNNWIFIQTKNKNCYHHCFLHAGQEKKICYFVKYSEWLTFSSSQPLSLIICTSSIIYFPSLYFWLDSNACS
jgi:hypothetical protein